jgi:hypothetical protein
MKLVRIPDMALGNPNIATNHWIRVECYTYWVWLRIGRWVLLTDERRIS